MAILSKSLQFLSHTKPQIGWKNLKKSAQFHGNNETKNPFLTSIMVYTWLKNVKFKA